LNELSYTYSHAGFHLFIRNVANTCRRMPENSVHGETETVVARVRTIAFFCRQNS
jgi:hypothetical protein